MSEAKVRVLDVAEELFMSRGYEVVKLRDIADKLGIKQPSLYYHFEDGKEQIYVEVVIRKLIKVHEAFDEIRANSPLDIETILINIGHWAVDNMGMSPVVMNKIDMPLLSETNRNILRERSFKHIFGPIIDIVKHAQDRGEFREINPAVAAGVILSSLEAMDERIPIGSDKKETWKQVVEMLLHGLVTRN